MSQVPFAQVSRDVLRSLRDDHNLRLLYYDFTTEAHYGDTPVSKWSVILKSGELVTSAGEISRRYGWTYQESKTCLAKLKMLGVVRLETVRCYNPDKPSGRNATRVTILDGVNGRRSCDYHGEAQPATTGQPPGNHRATTEQPPGNHRATTQVVENNGIYGTSKTTEQPPGNHRATTEQPPSNHRATTPYHQLNKEKQSKEQEAVPTTTRLSSNASEATSHARGGENATLLRNRKDGGNGKPFSLYNGLPDWNNPNHLWARKIAEEVMPQIEAAGGRRTMKRIMAVCINAAGSRNLNATHEEIAKGMRWWIEKSGGSSPSAIRSIAYIEKAWENPHDTVSHPVGRWFAHIRGADEADRALAERAAARMARVQSPPVGAGGDSAEREGRLQRTHATIQSRASKEEEQRVGRQVYEAIRESLPALDREQLREEAVGEVARQTGGVDMSRYGIVNEKMIDAAEIDILIRRDVFVTEAAG